VISDHVSQPIFVTDVQSCQTDQGMFGKAAYSASAFPLPGSFATADMDIDMGRSSSTQNATPKVVRRFRFLIVSRAEHVDLQPRLFLFLFFIE
jgi:hypothetical protein